MLGKSTLNLSLTKGLVSTAEPRVPITPTLSLAAAVAPHVPRHEKLLHPDPHIQGQQVNDTIWGVSC